MCNPVGYDRRKRLYKQESSPAWRPLVVHFSSLEYVGTLHIRVLEFETST